MQLENSRIASGSRSLSPGHQGDHQVSLTVYGSLVAMERHLWLNLTGIKEKEKNFLMDASLSLAGLLSDTVNTVTERFQEAKKAGGSFPKIAGQEQPQPSASSSPRAQQKKSVVSRAPSQKNWETPQHSQVKPSKRKTDLRTVTVSRNALSKKKL